MEEWDSQPAPRADQTPDEQGETQAGQAAEGLREQIAALRKQVKDAQDTLRAHHREREGRSFKR